MNKEIRDNMIADIEAEMICCPHDDPCGSWLCSLGRDFIKIINIKYEESRG